MEPITQAAPILLAAVEWGRSTAKAARSKKQQRSANLLEHAAILVAGLRHLDQRFTELFVPLTFYDPRSWPIERRQRHAEDILAFIFHDQVISELSDAMTWLKSSPADDPQVRGLIDILCDIVAAAIWTVPASEEVEQAALSDPDGRREFQTPLTWVDGARWHAIDPYSQDIDWTVGPAVIGLADVLRSSDPSSDHVRASARMCLMPPEEVGPPTTRGSGALRVEARVDPRGAPAPPAVGPPMPNVSPLRRYADNAGGRFQELLATVQATFPDIPSPRWVYGG